MPIGLVVGAFVFVWIAVLFHRQKLALTARHCVILAAIWVFPTMLFGIMDWQHYYAGAMLFPIKVKMILAPALTILLWIAVILGYKKGGENKAVVAIYCVCFLIVVALGYFGGQLGSCAPRERKSRRQGIFRQLHGLPSSRR
jgi:hypothetical protein